MDDPKDRRKHPRLEGEFPVDLLNMGDDPAIPEFEVIVPGTALDVSRQGLRLASSYQVPVGTMLSAIVYHNGRESMCVCEVVWRRDQLGQPLYGLYIKEWSKMDPVLEQKLSTMETVA